MSNDGAYFELLQYVRSEDDDNPVWILDKPTDRLVPEWLNFDNLCDEDEKENEKKKMKLPLVKKSTADAAL